MKTSKIICHPVTFGKVDEKYKDFKNEIMNNLNGKFDNEVSIRIILYLRKERVTNFRNDLDNFLKPIIDAIKESGVIDYESQISKIQIKRIFDEEEGVEIEIIE